jgi:hypothetical protein
VVDVLARQSLPLHRSIATSYFQNQAIYGTILERNSLYIVIDKIQYVEYFAPSHTNPHAQIPKLNNVI